MDYIHADVFSASPLAGNGLTVLFDEGESDVRQMQQLAREFKQFETIFLRRIGERRFRARIFTVEEELDFAGHPILGAAAAIHDNLFPELADTQVTFELNHKTVETRSVRKGGYFRAEMDQGRPQFLGVIGKQQESEFLHALSLTGEDLARGFSMEVVSTGLPYLIVPLSAGLERARICVADLEARLGRIGAKFVYVFDLPRKEGRTWDNLGAVEDVATGSAAGPVGAYLRKWGLCNDGNSMVLQQGRFVGRPSQLQVSADRETGELTVAGDVCIVAAGTLRL